MRQRVLPGSGIRRSLSGCRSLRFLRGGLGIVRMRVVILRVSHASIVPAERVSLNPRRAVCSHSASIPPHSASSIRGLTIHSLPLARPRYTTTYTTCISTYRNFTVENMSEKSFGNNPTHQNSSSQISAAGTARPVLPLRKLYGMRFGLAGITLAWLGQAVTLIDFTLCIVFIIVLVRVFSRRRQSTVQL